MSNWNVDIDGVIIDLDQVQLITYNSVIDEICFHFINCVKPLYQYYNDEPEKGLLIFDKLKFLLGNNKKKAVPVKKRTGKKPNDLVKCPIANCVGGLVDSNGYTETCPVCNGYAQVSKRKLGVM